MQPNNRTNPLITDPNADFIFKKGNYTNTYIIVNIGGIPSNCTLNLLDENLNQLYSPVDINRFPNKTPCSVTSNHLEAIQLPANYSNNGYTDFPAGTYNWNLKFSRPNYQIHI